MTPIDQNAYDEALDFIRQNEDDFYAELLFRVLVRFYEDTLISMPFNIMCDRLSKMIIDEYKNMQHLN